MKPVWRYVTRVLLALAALVLVLVVFVYVASAVQARRHFTVPAEALRAATDSGRIAHGKRLVNAITACRTCHGADLGGDVFISAAPFGRWYAPNLTTGRGGAARVLNDAQLEAVIRHGVMPDGRSAYFMPAEVFIALSDDDLAAILGYLRSAPPVDRVTPPPTLGPVARALLAFGKHGFQAAYTVDQHAAHRTTAPAPAPTVEYGGYLIHVAGCVRCHGSGLSGGPIPNMGPSAKPAANLTPAGIGHYTAADFARALREGMRPGGAPIDTLMPWRSFRFMSDTDLTALYTHLRSVPPKAYGNR